MSGITTSSYASSRSTASGRSYQSRRARQKAERRRTTPKAGTAEEEEALVTSLLTLIPSVELKRDVKAMIRALLLLNMHNDAASVQQAFQNLIAATEPQATNLMKERQELIEKRLQEQSQMQQQQQPQQERPEQQKPQATQAPSNAVDWKVSWLPNKS